MKLRSVLSICVLLALAPIILFAQDGLPEVPAVVVSDWTQLVPVAMAFLAPVLLGWLKKLIIVETVRPDGTVVKSLPKWFPKWAPLVVAPLLMFLSDYMTQLLGGPGLSPLLLTLLVPVSTWLREVGDQVKKLGSGVSPYIITVPAGGAPYVYDVDPRIADRPQSPTETGDSTR